MKILVVDDNAHTKCVGIMEECEKRGIEVEIAIASKQAIFSICSEAGKMIDGIILDMDLPLFPHNKEIKQREGESILRKISKKHGDIPTLIFSQTNVSEKYEQVFGQMQVWNKVEFLLFLEKVRIEKERREEQRRLNEEKRKEDEEKAKAKTKTKKFALKKGKKRKREEQLS